MNLLPSWVTMAVTSRPEKEFKNLSFCYTKPPYIKNGAKPDLLLSKYDLQLFRTYLLTNAITFKLKSFVPKYRYRQSLLQIKFEDNNGLALKGKICSCSLNRPNLILHRKE